MTTAAKAARSFLTLEINGTPYRVERPDFPAEVTAGVRLTKLSPRSPASYDVVFLADGTHACGCGDFQHRHLAAGTRCKHIEACVEHALVPAAESEVYA